MREIFSKKGYTLLSKEYLGNKIPLIFEKDGYKYCLSYNAFIKTNSPKRWGQNNPYSMYNIGKYLKEEKAECELISTEYDYNSIRLKCKCQEEYTVSLHNLLTKKQYCCPKCGRSRGAVKHIKDIEENLLKLLEEYGLQLLEEYKGTKAYHWCITKDGLYTKIKPYALLRDTNPYYFIFDVKNKYALMNIETWLNKNNGLKFLSKEYKGSKYRYKFLCKCGEVFESSWQYIYLHNINRCPKCSNKISGLELKTKEWLDSNAIDYVQEKIFEGCSYKGLLRFDFYLPKINAAIEVDGRQHYQPTAFGELSEEKVKQNYEEMKIRDEIKNNFCKDNSIKLLRIPYYYFHNEEYKNILSTFMAKI